LQLALSTNPTVEPSVLTHLPEFMQIHAKALKLVCPSVLAKKPPSQEAADGYH